MKSINEFATEYAQDKYLPVQTSQAVKAGVNYVLDLLQKRLSDRHFTSAAFLQMDIEDFIKELKML